MTTTAKRWGFSALAGIAALGVAATATPAKAEITESTPGAQKAVDLIKMWVQAGAPNGAFTYKDLSGNSAKGSFDGDILPLLTTNGIWGEDTLACTSCHMGNTEESLHEMDLTSYEGMLKGADALSSPPGVTILGNTKVGTTDFNWDKSKLRHRLRDNRMPPGVEFDITEENRDGPCVEVGSGGAKIMKGEYGCETNVVGMFGAWIDAGAPKSDKVAYGGGNITFEGDLLPIFKTNGIWGEDTLACTSCHMGNTEESLHEMDLTSYEGMLKGADALSSPPGVTILGNTKVGTTDFNFGHSKLRDRLRNNRMPPGIEFDITEENRDGPIVLHGKR